MHHQFAAIYLQEHIRETEGIERLQREKVRMVRVVGMRRERVCAKGGFSASNRDGCNRVGRSGDSDDKCPHALSFMFQQLFDKWRNTSLAERPHPQ